MAVNKNRKKTGWIILASVFVLVALLVFFGLPFLAAQKIDMTNVRTAKAETRTIEKSVSCTGNLTTDDEFEEISAESGLIVEAIAAEAGDVVKKGDTLAVFDAISLQTAIWNAQDEIKALDAQINKVRKKTESTYILAPVAGRIKQINVSEGDSINGTMQAEGALIVLSVDGKMRVSFVPETTDKLSAGDDVLVKLSDHTKISGSIEIINKNNCIVTLSDQIPEVNAAVKICREDGTVIGTGHLEINRPIQVTGTEGSVKSVLKSKNSLVSSGTRLIQLEQAAISREYLKLAASRTEQLERLDALLDYASHDNSLTAATAGTIEKVGLIEGKTTGSGNASEAAAASAESAFKVKTKNTFKLNVNIDELDISYVKTGLKARISFDALPNTVLTGTLEEIDELGITAQNGTTYKGTVELSSESSLKYGMTATAVIIVDRQENIICIPVAALQESGDEQYVYVGTAAGPAVLGEKRLVKTGISDGQYVEIVSGLSSGEAVNYYYASGNSSLSPFGNSSRFGNSSDASGNGTASTDFTNDR